MLLIEYTIDLYRPTGTFEKQALHYEHFIAAHIQMNVNNKIIFMHAHLKNS